MNRSAPPRHPPGVAILPLLLLAALLLPECQTVPATGETRLSLVSTSEEIRIGREAVGGFLAAPEIASAGTRGIEVNGNPGEIGDFTLRTDREPIQGAALFVEYRGRIYRLLGYGTAEGWRQEAGRIRESLLSFAELTDPRALSVQPLVLQILRVRGCLSLEEYYRQRGSPVPLSQIALLNRMEPGEWLGRGELIKWVADTRQWSARSGVPGLSRRPAGGRAWYRQAASPGSGKGG